MPQSALQEPRPWSLRCGQTTSRLFAANCAWLDCAVIAHNLLRAAGVLAGGNHAVARGAAPTPGRRSGQPH